MKVSAVIVTRGDVDLGPIWESLPPSWEQVTWNNGGGGRAYCRIHRNGDVLDEWVLDQDDQSVFGRYRAIPFATGDVIYVQDDDCIVSDPAHLVATWTISTWARTDHMVCNMPEPWRSNPFYSDHALVGFGAAFHRKAPEKAFQRFAKWCALQSPDVGEFVGPEAESFYRATCDIVFTGLTPRVLISVPHESMPYAWGDDRMWRQPEHQPMRDKMLSYVLAAAAHGG